MSNKPALVVINGWAMPHSVWGQVGHWLSENFDIIWFDIDRDRSIEAWHKELLSKIPGQAAWLGWSLGGLIAMSFAKAYPEKVSRLLLITSSPRFVETANWPNAQPVSTLNNLRRLIERSAASLIKRFAVLQTLGGVGEREDTRQILLQADEHEDIYSKDTLIAGLALLEGLDMRTWLADTSLPVTCILGGGDRVVLVKKQDLTALNPAIRVHVVENMAHFPFLSHAQQVITILQDECLPIQQQTSGGANG